MSKQSNQRIAAELAARLANGNSPFDIPGFRMPVNPTTGKSYRGMNALWLAIQDRNDPRWMTLKQASNKNNWKVEKGSKGTLISFLKTTDRVTLLDENGRPQLNTKRNPKTELIKLAEPVETDAYVFNGEQIEGILPLAEYQAARQSWLERNPPGDTLAKLVELSNLSIEETTGDPGYDLEDRIIYMPEQTMFTSPQEYQAAVLYQMVSLAGEIKELYNPISENPAEAIKPALAALFLGSEIGIPSQLAAEINLEEIMAIAVNSPDDLEMAANSAQYMTDALMNLENPRELRQSARNEYNLQVGDVIDYNERQYEVVGRMRGRDLQVLDKSNDNRFRINPDDGVYKSLLAARNEALKPKIAEAQMAAQEQVMGPEEELDHSMAYEHADELEHEAGQAFEHAQEIYDNAGDEDIDMPLVLDPTAGESKKAGAKR